MRIERFVPASLKNPYRRLRSALKNMEFGHRNADIFDEIYRRRCWGGQAADGELYSGPGTYDPSVTQYIDFVLAFIKERGIRSIVEIGCGDFAIGRRYADMVDHYLGIDVSSLVVESNTRRFASETVTFIHGDAGELDVAPADLCIIRQVLQHLDNTSVTKILRKCSSHRYLLITEHLPSDDHLIAPNLDKKAGPDTRLVFGSGVYVECPPFNRNGETVLSLPVEALQAHPGETLRTTLIANS